MSLAMKSQAKVKKKPKVPEVMEKPPVDQKISAQVFSFRDIAIATHNFRIDNLVGDGGFGRVYKGRIPGKDKTIAVKKLHRNGNQGNKEFLSAVSMLSQLSHPNLVNLIGYCTDGDQRILVFEYMANGCLENHLLDVPPNKEPLDWYKRMKIAHGAARGLEYLHEQAKPPVIYRDFKTSNILLDEEFNARLCDFDLPKIDPSGENDSVSNRIMGTYGYCAPEYTKTGQFTTMSDVYSFGVVFLELISGRRAIDTTKPTEEQNLTTWAKPIFKDRKLYKQIIDPLLDDKYPENGFYQTIAVAAMILQDEPNTRPLISDIVVALEFLAKPPEDQGSPKGIIVTGLDKEDITDEEAKNDRGKS